MSDGKSSNGKLALASAAVAAGGIFDIATSAAPGPTTVVLEWILLVCLLVGLVGWYVEHRSPS